MTIQTEEKDLQFARCQLSVFEIVGGEPNVLGDYSFRPETLKSSWNFRIILKNELIAKCWLPLECEFTIATDEIWIDPIPKCLIPPVNTALQTTTHEQKDFPLGGLGKDLLRTYTEKKFCDVTVKSSSGM